MLKSLRAIMRVRLKSRGLHGGSEWIKLWIWSKEDNKISNLIFFTIQNITSGLRFLPSSSSSFFFSIQTKKTKSCCLLSKGLGGKNNRSNYDGFIFIDNCYRLMLGFTWEDFSPPQSKQQI